MRLGMVFKLTQAHFCHADTKLFNNGTAYFHENDKNKAITGWKFKNRRRIMKDNVYQSI